MADACPTCGHAVRVVGHTTKHYQPVGCPPLVDRCRPPMGDTTGRVQRVANALTLLVHASRVSPHLRGAVAVVEARLQSVEAENERLRTDNDDMRRAIDSGCGLLRRLGGTMVGTREVVDTVIDLLTGAAEALDDDTPPESGASEVDGDA